VCTYDAVLLLAYKSGFIKMLWQTDVDIKGSSHGKSYLKFSSNNFVLVYFLAEHFH
jgi:hypothetical protein